MNSAAPLHADVHVEINGSNINPNQQPANNTNNTAESPNGGEFIFYTILLIVYVYMYIQLIYFQRLQLILIWIIQHKLALPQLLTQQLQHKHGQLLDHMYI